MDILDTNQIKSIQKQIKERTGYMVSLTNNLISLSGSDGTVIQSLSFDFSGYQHAWDQWAEQKDLKNHLLEDVPGEPEYPQTVAIIRDAIMDPKLDLITPDGGHWESRTISCDIHHDIIWMTYLTGEDHRPLVTFQIIQADTSVSIQAQTMEV